LAVHITAPTIHAGFEGRIVLEMYNFGPYPLRLRAKELAICQLIFERLGKIPKGQVKTSYKGQKSIR
jgi:dCTP deaminase